MSTKTYNGTIASISINGRAVLTWPYARRFEVRIPVNVAGSHVGQQGYVVMQVMATNIRQARKFARKEMLMLTRQNVNRAQITDSEPPEETESGRLRRL
jgi:hypothetical protein